MLIYMHFFSYININSTYLGYLIYLATFFLWTLTLFSIKPNHRVKEKSYNYVLLFALWPFLTAISSLVCNEQSFQASLIATLPHWALLSYFFCLKSRISTTTIIKIIIIFALIRTGLTVVQQFTYPSVLFSMRTGIKEQGFVQDEIRSGIHRFLISDAYYLPLFSGFYAYSKIISSKIKLKYILLFLISFVALYLDQSRQVIFSFIVALLITPLLSKSYKKRYFSIVFLILLLFYFGYDFLLGELGEQTSNEFNEDNIRVFSYAYYWENLGNWFSAIFGNGFAGKSEYGDTIVKMQDLGLWRVDIGIVGAIHIVGFGFVALFLAYCINVIFSSWRNIDLSIKLLFVSIFIQFPLIFPIYNTSLPAYEFFMGLIFYLVDKSIVSNAHTNLLANKKYSNGK